MNGSTATTPRPTLGEAPGGITLVEAVPFTLGTPMTHWWRSERPRFERGALLVLRTTPHLLLQRQAASPVLFCGAETVQILNHGHASGYAIVVVPFFGEQSIDDLSDACLYFGIDELPERLSQSECRTQEEIARRSGTPSVGKQRLEHARRSHVHFNDEIALYRHAGSLVARYSPSEHDKIRWLKGH